MERLRIAGIVRLALGLLLSLLGVMAGVVGLGFFLGELAEARYWAWDLTHRDIMRFGGMIALGIGASAMAIILSLRALMEEIAQRGDDDPGIY